MIRRALVFGRLGYRAGRHRPLSGVVHRLGLLLAATVMVLSGWLVLAIDSVGTHQQERVDAREPIFVAEDADVRPVAHWLDVADHYADRQFMLTYLVPLDPAAAPPPGLPRWPRPGEAFISPGLLAADTDGTLARRYGSFAGPIARAGLTDANEWLIYARPLDDAVVKERGQRTMISGFGPSADEPERTTWLYDYGPASLYQLLLWCLGAPAVVLLVVASRVGSDTRDRRVAMLDALGAPRAARAWFLAGEAAPSVIAGATLGGVLGWLPTMVDITLPVVAHTVQASDLRPARGWLPAVVFAGALIVTAVAVVAAWRPERAGGTSPRTVRSRVRRWPRVLFTLALAAMVWIATTAYREGGAGFGTRLDQAFLLSLAVVLLTTPATVATFAGPAGRGVAWLGRHLGSQAALVGGRWLQHRWSALARMGAAAIVGLCLACLVSVNVAAPSSAATSAVREQLGDRVLTVRGGENSERYDRFLSQVGRHRSLQVVLDGENQPVLVGDCEALGQLGAVPSCPPTPTEWDVAIAEVYALGAAIESGMASVLVSGKPRLSRTLPTRATSIGVLVLNSRGEAETEAVNRTAHATLGIADVSTPGQYSIGGNHRLRSAYAWFAQFFVAGLLVLLISTVLGALDVFAVQARSLGPIGSMHGGWRLYVGVATCNIGTLLTLVALGGGAMAMLLSFLYIRLRASGVAMPWSTLSLGLVGIGGLAVALSLWCGWVAGRAGRAWRPFND